MKKKVSYYEETHCAECGDVVHNHFDCPACKYQEAGTNAYMEMRDFLDAYGGAIQCENCDFKFKAVWIGYTTIELNYKD